MVTIAAVFLSCGVFKWAMINLFTEPNQRLMTVCASAVLKFLISAPVICGMGRLIYLNLLGNEPDAFGVFYFFEKTKRYLRLVFLLILVLLRVCAVFLIPAAIAAGGVLVYRYFEVFDIYTLFLLFLIIVSAVIAFQVSLYISLRYFLCVSIFIKDENMKIRRIIKESAVKMSDKRSEMLTVIYSLLPSSLLCLLVFPALAAIPYMVAVFTVYGTMYLKQFFIKEKAEKTILFEAGE